MFPFSTIFSVDAEGFTALQGAIIEKCIGNVITTDDGGGKLTEKHLNIVMSHVGYAEVIVWSDARGDIEWLRMACLEMAAKMN